MKFSFSTIIGVRFLGVFKILFISTSNFTSSLLLDTGILGRNEIQSILTAKSL